MTRKAMEEAIGAINEVAENLLFEENLEEIRKGLELISSMCRHGGDLRPSLDK